LVDKQIRGASSIQRTAVGCKIKKERSGNQVLINGRIVRSAVSVSHVQNRP
jgi:hypothetical protein